MPEARRSTRTADEANSEAPVSTPALAPASGPTVAVSRLIAEADAFVGHPSHVAAGALAHKRGDEEITVDAARQEIESWLDHPAKED